MVLGQSWKLKKTVVRFGNHLHQIMPVNMPSKMEEGDEYDADDFEETETMISKDRSNRPKSAMGFMAKKSSKMTKRMSGTSHKRRAQSAGLTRTSREKWISAVKKGQTTMLANGRQSPRHKTPVEYWVETLRKTGSGISTESTGMNTFTGLKKANEKYYPYMSTSHFMRQVMGTEKANRYDDPTVKPSPGRPNYKTPEEYYDEVLELRKQIAALNLESGTMKTKIRRLEEDNVKKEKEIESLLNPGMSEEIRRTLGDRKPESGAVIHSLKQKILKLEVQLRDRESAYNKLQADLKVTKVEELRGQMEVMYQEIVRLQHCKDSSPSTKGSHENTVKVKALNETILRLSKNNEQLLQENRALKEDLSKAFEEADTKPNENRECEDMDRKQLLLMIKKLERRTELAERQVDSDTLSVVSGVSGREGRAGSLAATKLVLQGSLQERLTQLDQRETELLEEIQRLKLIIKRLRDEKRKHADEGKPETGSLPPTPRHRSSRSESGSLMGSRRPSRQESVISESSSTQRKVNDFKQKHAALNIQRQWRQHKQQQEMEEKVKKFQENHAAKTIQNKWLKYKHDQYEADDAAYMIQSALKAHKSRQAQMKRYRDDEDSIQGDDDDDDDDIYLIQSSIKGQHSRRDQMRQMRQQGYDSYEDEDEYYDTRSGGQPRKPSIQQLSAKEKPKRQLLTYTPVASSSNAPTDDDDDIMF
ncbi:IQ domain-containing protein E-like isoform X2 [Pomacea canaliculata]|uniref:IQ domain-containing protein E-like isoform X2 n=1 Tax=Pomacea canaliculata TaxID=400727 RepID=UPI000D733D2F|nr:IQ domain-containing protein E-like isoform X2 [Pomacea canaliculata]